MSQSTATTNLPAGKVHCCSDPRTCGSRAPEAPRLSTTAERFALNTSYDGTAHQRQTTTKKTTSATQQSTARRPTNATARRTPSSKPGETKKTASCASCWTRWAGSRLPPLRSSVRARHPRHPCPTPSSTHQTPLPHRASAGRIPRTRRTDGHPPALGRRTDTLYVQLASPFHSRTPSLSRTELPFVNPSLSRESPGLTN